MRTCEGLVDSLLYVIKACVNTSDFDSKVHARTDAHARCQNENMRPRGKTTQPCVNDSMASLRISVQQLFRGVCYLNPRAQQQMLPCTLEDVKQNKKNHSQLLQMLVKWCVIRTFSPADDASVP